MEISGSSHMSGAIKSQSHDTGKPNNKAEHDTPGQQTASNKINHNDSPGQQVRVMA